MFIEGNIQKMRSVNNHPVDYFLMVGNHEINLNQFLNKQITFTHNGIINCIHCGKQTKKSFSQGFCFNCFQTAPEADQSIFSPELSLSQFGIARDMQWAEEHDLIDHFVYLSITSGLKVGVTRFHQIPTRWIDQGAVAAIKLARTPNRHIAGVIETQLKQHVADTTQWQAMLKDVFDGSIDLVEEKKKLSAMLHPELQKYLISDNEICNIEYPGDLSITKINSLSFDNTPIIKGVLSRIKGQYLVFENGDVLNIRKHNGYYVSIEVN